MNSNIIIRSLFPALYRVGKRDRVIYLTFDDGPSSASTSEILSLLDRESVKATFFCIGENVQRYPELYRAIIDAGHRVGNHTMNHANGFALSTKKYLESVSEASKFVASKLFRPPYGRIKPWQIRAVRKLGYKVVMWDVIAWDWDSKLTPDDVLSIIKRDTRNGSIIVLHDSAKAAPRTLKILEEAIVWLKNEGYRFELISED